jgi:cation diffusion facilitator family transporter
MDNGGNHINSPAAHRHEFLGAGHARNERRTWAVVSLCTMMMLLEIIAGTIFGSLALVADGWHMSTHAGALLLAALAYRYARRHSDDPRFVFGTGKLGDLAAFTSAIILALIAVLIGYEAVFRLFAPVPIDFAAAIPIAALGLAVNLISAWLLSGDHGHGGSHHHNGPSPHHGHPAGNAHCVRTPWGNGELEIFETGAPPCFRLHKLPIGCDASVETIRPDGSAQSFPLRQSGLFMESVDEIPEPHEFTARIYVKNGSEQCTSEVLFEEHAHHHGTSAIDRDNNIRAAFVHVFADAAVSMAVILGLLAAKFLGWIWMDPIMGLVGALVIANWSINLIRATVGILVDMTPDSELAARIRRELEKSGDKIRDLHVWRVGPGHLSAIISLESAKPRPPAEYKLRLAHIAHLSHITVEVQSAA